MPISAYVFIHVEAGRIFNALEVIKKVDGVKEVCAITGEYDIIAKVEAADLCALGDVVVKGIQMVKGVVKTVTSLIVA